MLRFGTIQELRVEQVKGITYSLDALLGVERPGTPTLTAPANPDMAVVDDHEFANINGIEYSLKQLIGTPGSMTPVSTPGTPAEESNMPRKFGDRIDASVVEPERDVQKTMAHDASVALEMGIKSSVERRRSASGASVKPCRRDRKSRLASGSETSAESLKQTKPWRATGGTNQGSASYDCTQL